MMIFSSWKRSLGEVRKKEGSKIVMQGRRNDDLCYSRQNWMANHRAKDGVIVAPVWPMIGGKAAKTKKNELRIQHEIVKDIPEKDAEDEKYGRKEFAEGEELEDLDRDVYLPLPPLPIDGGLPVITERPCEMDSKVQKLYPTAERKTKRSCIPRRDQKVRI